MSEELKALDRQWYCGTRGVWPPTRNCLPRPGGPRHPAGGDAGLRGIKQAISIQRTGFPDLHFQVHDQIAEGDKVVSRWTFSGTHTRDWIGIPPTGKPVSCTGMSIQRYAGGKMIESWLEIDNLGWLQQLGAVPSGG